LIKNSTIKNLASDNGFDLCGISAIARVEPLHAEALANWINKSVGSDLEYVKKYLHLRLEPSQVLEGAKSIIIFGLNYYKKENQEKQNQKDYKVSMYAMGKNYHNVIQKKLREFEKQLKKLDSEIELKSFVDTAPVMEKYWAMKAGLGNIGKNTCFIAPRKGSWFFLCGILVNKEIEADKAYEKDLCGKCRKCIEACPTGAIEEDKILNAKKCISYLSIEHKSEFDQSSPEWKNWIWGCDICQQVCPHNKFATDCENSNFSLLPQIEELMDLKLWDSENEFIRKYSGTSVKRGGYERIIRNIRKVKHGKI